MQELSEVHATAMRVTIADVEKIASLAKLAVSDEEKIKFRKQLEEMLDYVDKLNELDTEAVEPTFYILHPADITRDDRVTESIPRETALANAPERSLGFFKVPKVISRPDPKV